MSKNSLSIFKTSARFAAINPASRTFVTSRVFFNGKNKDQESTNETKDLKDQAEEIVDEEISPIEKDLKELKAKLEKKEKEYVELKDSYVRSIADFRNLQETTKREIQKAKDFALQKFAKDLIESIDNFGHALSAVKEDSVKANEEIAQLYDGVKLTRDVFEKTLVRHGMKKIDPIDEEFDPNKHEATFQAHHEEKEPGTVFFVQQPGYELNGRVLRAAKVGIVKNKDE
jgi:molecular chaperone GrpE